MNPEVVRARRALLDALSALGRHRGATVLVGAQAIYLRTGRAAVALAEFTTDADLAIDPRRLRPDPRLEEALTAAGFVRDPRNPNPGAWVSADGTPVDLMVPDAVAGAGRRGVTVPPHDRRAMRRTVGLEAALVDNSVMAVEAFEDGDDRAVEVRVAGNAALIVAKLHKIEERRLDPRRRQDKDAHDIYRILVSTSAEELKADLQNLLAQNLSRPTTERALVLLNDLFVGGPDSPGAEMAGRAEVGIGDPAQTSLAASILAQDLASSLYS
ncbi:hypothetical protein CQ040_10385 [Microbacterium sp. MYb54]|nr:hypothetical protein CQ032_17145 [Microbacterium sp. MYb43]PQZ81049.1 hypothetical protein CQ031_06265 [Microbacterium sp. MYb40]PRB20881.1 hypothetical protein CQ040_10385 [Microbacterium sp. MYb54]PRB32078.1 hypothetical protein CQ037_00050 [Microbacterium sp. MYb50]PRB61867.1 hypothetical protein CQ021_17480 [Microbacterium sp. MYb24]PRB67425.1 hypothetical protein CQ027_18435 [Microbacterium sp. MYb32]